MSVEINENGDLDFSDDEDPCLEERHPSVEEVNRDAGMLKVSAFDRVIEAFIDEPPFQHNVVPESDSEDEVGGRDLRVHDFQRSDEELFVGRTFSCKEDFVEAVLTYALKGCLNIKRERYDKTNLAYCCVGGNCNWRVYCAKYGGKQVWEITVMTDKHICVPSGECDMLKVPVIATLFKDKLREEPEYYMPMKIASTIKENWGITASRPQCQAARNKALRWIQREYDEQFKRMRDYKAEILLSNPQSTVAIETLRSAEGLDLFNCFYVCFDRLKASWKDYCRPLIGVDGAHLKSKMKGQLLVAIGRDANNAIYPIAWSVVQVENTPNWAWFLNNLKHDLGLGNGEGYVLVSDRQKGLVHAVEDELPNIEHRMCVRHIYNNLKTRHPKKPEM